MKGLSPRAQRIIVALAQDEGRKSGSAYLLPEHVILALLKNADSVGYSLLLVMNVNVLNFQLALEQSLIPAKNTSGGIYELPPSRRLSALIDSARVEAQNIGDEYIGTEHLMIAAIREERSITNRYFIRSGISIELIRSLLPDARARTPSSANEKGQRNLEKSIINDLFGPKDLNDEQFFEKLGIGKSNSEKEEKPSEETVQPQNNQKVKNQAQKNSILSEYSRDLTAEAKSGACDPVVGREKEIQRVIQILSRRNKNNPLLIGEPGVGKTAIVEGLSRAIVNGEVPFNLLKKKVMVLDLGALIAGTKYRGDFEDRLKKIMNEVKNDRNVLLFIDEIHTIIGAGGQAGQMDASNMLKPALSRGEIQIIGATTRKEYRKYLEKDSAFERRFQVVKVEEPTDTETSDILNGIKKKYEEYHNVHYADDVIPLIVRLSHRYVPERFLPDKAIDILDEAGAQKKIKEENRPSELDELEKNIEDLIEEKKKLVENQKYEKAAMVRDKVVALKEKLEMYSEYWKKNNVSMLKEVNTSDVCSVVSQMTGIPIDELDVSQIERLVHMEDEIHKTVIGQNEAIKIISSAVRRNRAGISSTKRPIGSFIFLGPTGVGKTQLAKTLAKFLFGTEDSLVRIDMSDYMERHTASRLVGAPPGYVGYEEGGVLTEKVRQHPYSVILFDEIEKAHPDVFNLMLQILEEGELSDGLGHNVSFKNTVIIMTSNAGAREIISEGKIGFNTVKGFGDSALDYNNIKANAVLELKKIMSPELINRIDDIIVFTGLSQKEVEKILDTQIKELADRLSEKGLKLTVKPAAKKYMVEHGYDPEMGARPMRRMIQREVEDPLSIMILTDGEKASKEIVIDCTKDKLDIKYKKTRKETKKIEAEVNHEQNRT
ncbi:MAG: ATP-dependent Clp protease ATP-binding subunit [Treponema sp.]|uniref:ATP-dependent Clp protease ATP-binding subunit n=1 Tax=Treponema sp. TaxID=166 RepID=UPI001B6C2BB6|nr:ATP-dependent Clp protease ATP-binding subunit [Treponema sp.]MBP5402925.1 ATP-dependent Clp protease ATP-binding subunit [Treponema sp.]MBR5932979.1 ATP-dependent Clp protease ATP-binding subunit [Treponema sp.]